MGKFIPERFYAVIAAMLLCILVAIFSAVLSSRTVRMTLTPIEVETGETVHYADSTCNARSWLWEFGNGDISHESSWSGEYVFKKPGRYQVRLQVDGGLERKQIIAVHRSRDDYGSDELAGWRKHRQPPFKGEIVSFSGYGPSKEWRWQFGESELPIRGSRTHSTPIQNPACTRFC
ncbi:PKD domain-containing protein [Bacteroides thetaiotaomicron]|nr:PKD domain-containing protein [Bacteroides thetaiotaomicron]